MNASAVYLGQLEVINRISKTRCKRYGLFGADAEDFASEVRLRLLEDDYAVIRKHRGDSTMNTFLAVVIGNLFRGYRIRTWGWLEHSGRVHVERKELRLISAGRRQKLDMLHQAVARILATLESEDQLIIRLRFYEGFSIADVARALGIPKKPLYPRINRLLQTLSNALISEGIDPEVLDFFEPS